ncbi:serine hydrolase [bacterium]|nr:serine hydrolase [bacterium]
MVRQVLMLTLGIGVFLLVATAAQAQDDAPALAGHWEGAVEVPGMELKSMLDFEYEDDAWTGTIDIPAQNAKDLPLANISFDDGKAVFSIEGVPGDPTFEGKIAENGESMSGDFTQGGQTFPFSLTKGENRVAKAQEALDGFDDVVTQALEDFNAPGIGIGVVVDGELIIAKGYGLRDIDGELPVTEETLFPIGSSTKAFTAFTMATLVDDGDVDWDAPVAQYIPGFKLYDEYATAHITPRDLLTHRSGLPRHDLMWYNKQDIPRKEMVRRLRFLEPNKELREVWQYNNLMFMTAGYVIEQVTGQTWEEAVRERVLDPLGMKATNFSVKETQARDNHATPYIEDDDELKSVAYRPIDVMGPAGSINSNVVEMANWLRVLLGSGKFNDETILPVTEFSELISQQMVISGAPQESWASPSSYAMGWFTDTYAGHYRVSHGGNIDGFSALVTFYPNDDLGIVALSNKNADPLPELLSREIADCVLKIESKKWLKEALKNREKFKDIVKEAEERKDEFRVPDTDPSHSMTEYAGEYMHPGYGTIEIDEKDGALQMIMNGMTMPLEHWHYDVFQVAEVPDELIPEGLKVQFRTSVRGSVSGLAAELEPMVSAIQFEKQADSSMSDPDYLKRLTGEYELAGQTFTVSLKNDHITLYVPGQPEYVLQPIENNEFSIEEATGFSVKFTLPEEGSATEVTFIQPNGVFTAERKEKDKDEE